jgi:hypothetical protein
MARLIAWKLSNHGVRTGGTAKLTSAGGSSARYPYGDRRRFPKVMGHRDTGVTACPGDQLYFQLPELRERIGERPPSGGEVDLNALLPELVTYTPEGFTFGGELLDGNAVPIAGATVELQRLRRTGWKEIAEAVTDDSGNFAATATFKRYKVVRWEFEGDDIHRAFRGDGVGVAVTPLITLDASTTSPETHEQIDLSGTTTPHKTDTLKLIVERYDEETARWRRVGRRKVESERGVFSKRQTFAEAGDYRLSVRFEGDTVSAAGASTYLELTVTEPVFPF